MRIRPSFITGLFLFGIILLLVFYLFIFARFLELSFADEGIKPRLFSFSTISSIVVDEWKDKVFGFSVSSVDDNLPEFRIQMDTDDISALNASLPRSGRDKKKGVLEYNNKNYNIEVRYKGDSLFHWMFPKKSYRVFLPDDDFIWGHNELPLNNIKSTSLMNVLLSTHLAKSMGLLVPESKHVKLFINNEYEGVYLFTEPLNENFFERNGVAVGDVFLGDVIRDGFIIGFERFIFENPFLWEQKIGDSSFFPLNGHLRSLLGLLQGIMIENDGMMKLSSLLDTESFASLMAFMSLTQSTHMDFAHNNVLHYDYTSGQFSQVPWDVNPWSRLLSTELIPQMLFGVLSRDPRFVFAKNTIAWDMLHKKDATNTLLSQLEEGYERIRVAAYLDKRKAFVSNPLRLPRSQKDFEQEVFELLPDRIRGVETLFNSLKDVSVKYRSSVAHGLLELTLDVEGYGSVYVKGLEGSEGCEQGSVYADRNQNGILDDADSMVDFEKPLLLHSGRLFSNTEFQNFYFTPFLGASALRYRFFVSAGATCVLEGLVLESAFGGEPIVAQELEVLDDTLLSAYSFHPWKLELDEQHYVQQQLREVAKVHPAFIYTNTRVRIPVGSYSLVTNLVLPEGSVLQIDAGVTLRLAEGISIISRGKVLAEGTKAAPIRIVAADSSRPFGVVGVANNGADGSRFTYVQMEYGSSTFVTGISFSGMLSVYHANDVVIEKSSFRYAQGDDAVNVKHSDASVLSSYFYKNSADALDFDSVSGEVRNSTFVENGDDGIDVSMSTAVIFGNTVFRSGDKGISFGEKSTPLVYNNIVDSCGTGMEVKDLSAPVVLHNVLAGNGVGINVYQKKEHFGGGRGVFVNTVLVDNAEEIVFRVPDGGKRLKSDDSTIDFMYSIVSGGYEGEGNVDMALEYEAFKAAGWRDERLEGVGDFSFSKRYIEQLEGDDIAIGILEK